MSEAPERIWIRNPDGRLDATTWQEHSFLGESVEYVRADRVEREWERIATLIQRIEELERDLADFHAIVSESEGVVGYHLNGDVATWDELLAAKASSGDKQ